MGVKPIGRDSPWRPCRNGVPVGGLWSASPRLFPFLARSMTLRCRADAPLYTEARYGSGDWLHPFLLLRARILVIPETGRQANRLRARLVRL